MLIAEYSYLIVLLVNLWSIMEKIVKFKVGDTIIPIDTFRVKFTVVGTDRDEYILKNEYRDRNDKISIYDIDRWYKLDQTSINEREMKKLLGVN